MNPALPLPACIAYITQILCRVYDPARRQWITGFHRGRKITSFKERSRYVKQSLKRVVQSDRFFARTAFLNNALEYPNSQQTFATFRSLYQNYGGYQGQNSGFLFCFSILLFYYDVLSFCFNTILLLCYSGLMQPPTQTFLRVRHAIIPLPRGVGTLDEPLRTFAWEARPSVQLFSSVVLFYCFVMMFCHSVLTFYRSVIRA